MGSDFLAFLCYSHHSVVVFMVRFCLSLIEVVIVG